MTLSGTWFVVPTAFAPDGSLDLEGQARVVEAAVRWGLDGLTVLGVMGEPQTLTEEERTEVLRATIKAAGGTPVAAGCSAPGAPVVAARIREAADLGASAVMVSAPPNVRDPGTLPRFYERATAGSPLPVIVQDEPAATGTVMPVPALLACVDACGATAVKLEDPPTPPKISALLEARPDLAVFGGLGGVSALAELGRGARGTMTGFAFPEALRKIRELIEAGDAAAAARLFDRWLPLLVFEGQPLVGLGIRKEVLRRRGALPHAATRGAPVPDAATLAELDAVLARVGVTPGPERLDVS